MGPQQRRTCRQPSFHCTHRHGPGVARCHTSSPVSTFHILQDMSAEAVSNRVESFVTSHPHTVPLCPSYVPTRSPLSEYQRVGRLSFEHVKSRSPSLLNRQCVRTLVTLEQDRPHGVKGGAVSGPQQSSLFGGRLCKPCAVLGRGRTFYFASLLVGAEKSEKRTYKLFGGEETRAHFAAPPVPQRLNGPQRLSTVPQRRRIALETTTRRSLPPSPHPARAWGGVCLPCVCDLPTPQYTAVQTI